MQCFLDNIIDELRRGNRLEFRDFGVFEIRTRAPRVAFNPNTLEQVSVPMKKTVKFKVGRLMKLGVESRTESTHARPTAAVPPAKLARSRTGAKV